MSEQESLINTEQETKNEVGEVAERPDWLPEKFWNDGNPDYENLSKSYAELEKLSSRKKDELTIIIIEVAAILATDIALKISSKNVSPTW